MKCATLTNYFWIQNEKTSAFFHGSVLPYPPTSLLPFHTLIYYAIVSRGVILPHLLPSAPHHKQRFMEQTSYFSLYSNTCWQVQYATYTLLGL